MGSVEVVVINVRIVIVDDGPAALIAQAPSGVPVIIVRAEVTLAEIIVRPRSDVIAGEALEITVNAGTIAGEVRAVAGGAKALLLTRTTARRQDGKTAGGH